MSEFEVVRGFSTENGEGRYDYDYLLNKPERASTEADGLAPQLSGDQSTFLRGDGEWAEIPVYAEATQQAAGLMSKEDKKKVDNMETTISNSIKLIDFPVDSVNGQTGAVILDSDAVGAVSKEKFEDEIELKADVVKEARGEIVTLSDTAEAPFQGLKLYGKTAQNGDPSPANPVPLESVGGSGSVKITACGGNMLPFPYEYSSRKSYGIEYTVGDDGSVAVKGTAEANIAFVLVHESTTDVVYPKGTYFLSGCPAGGSASTYSITLRSAGKTDTVQDTGKGVLFGLAEASKLHCSIYIRQGTKVDGLVFKPMLNVGSSAIPYERKPFQFLEISTPNGLPGIPVTSGGNYTDDNGQQWVCDEIDLKAGIYVQRVKEMVFDGIEDTGSYNPGVQMYQLTGVADAAKKTAVNNFALCAKYPYSSAANADMPDKHCKVHFTSTKVNMFIKDLNYTSDEAWTAYLSADPVTILYQLEDEKVRYLTEAEKANYTALITNYHNTTVYNDSDAGMNVSYATSFTALPVSGGHMAGDIDMCGNMITGVPSPKFDSDAVNKNYVDKIGIQDTNGSVIILNDSADAPIQGLKVFGKTAQNGDPTPTNPAPLVSVSAVTVCGKNIVDVFNENMTIIQDGKQATSYPNTVNADGSLNINHNGDFSYGQGFVKSLSVGQTVTISYNVDSFGNGTGLRFRIFDVNDHSTPKTTQLNDSLGKYTYTFTPNVDSIYMFGWYVVGSSEMPCKAQIHALQLEFGDTATEYGPYKDGGSLTVPTPYGLPGIKVSSGGNHTDSTGQQWVCDEIDFEKGQYIQRVAELTVASARKVTIGTTSAGLAYAEVVKQQDAYSVGGSAILCNTYSFITSGSRYGAIRNYRDTVAIYDERFTDVTKATDLLTNMGFVVLYQLETEKTIPLSEFDPDALTAYATLHTNYPNTTVYNDGGAEMEVKYATPITALPLTGGGRYKVATPYAPTDAVPKSYADRIDKKVDTLREIVSKFHSNIIQETSGDFITVSDSAKAPLQSLKVFGKTEQLITTGKNLLPTPPSAFESGTTFKNNGVTYTLNGDGSFLADGKATNTSNLVFWPTSKGALLFPAGDYIISGINANANFYFTAYDGQDNSGPRVDFQSGSEKRVTLTSGYLFNPRIVVLQGATVNDVMFYPMIRSASITDSTYEPYTGGIAVPNPEYPQALDSAGDGDDNISISVKNKNLIPYPYYYQESKGDSYTSPGGIDFTVNADGSITANGTNSGTGNDSGQFLFTDTTELWLPVGEYTLSTGVDVDPNKNWYLMASMRTGTAVSKYAYGGSVKFIVTEAGIGYVTFRVMEGKAVNNLTIYPQLEVGDTATAYEKPVVTQTLPISTPNGLPGIKVASGGNYTDSTGQQWLCDEIDFENNQYIRWVQDVTFDGTEGIATQNPSGNGQKAFVYSLDAAPPKLQTMYAGIAMCSHFTVTDIVTTNTNVGFQVRRTSSGLNRILFRPEGVADMDASAFKQWLAEQNNNGTPVQVLYILEKPKPIPLSDIAPDALAQYATLHTNYPNTTALNDGGAGMEVKYIADTKMYVDKKFEELAEILVNKL